MAVKRNAKSKLDMWKGYHLSIEGIRKQWVYLTINPRAQMGSESIAHEAEGRMGYTPYSQMADTREKTGA